MKKVWAGITVALGALCVFVFAGCSNEVDSSSNIAGLLAANSFAGSGETGSFILSGNESRAISNLDVKSAVVTVTGYDSSGTKFSRKSMVSQVSGGKAEGIIVENIPVSKNAVVSVQGYSDNAGKKAISGEIIRNCVEIKAGSNSSDVNWETSRVGYIYNALVEGGINTNILNSDYVSSISMLVSELKKAGIHASLIDTEKILAAVKSKGTISAIADDYKAETAILSYKAFNAEGYTICVQDTLSAQAVVSSSAGKITGIAPGKWNVTVKNGVNEVSSKVYEFCAGTTVEITVGDQLAEKTIIFVKADAAPSIWVWETDGVSISEKQGYSWNGQPSMVAVEDGLMNDKTGWFMYDVTGVASGKQITFKLNRSDPELSDAKCNKTFWYDGKNFYDADPTTAVLPDDNANLSDIKVNGTSIGVVTSYKVPYKVSSVIVEAVSESEKATVTVLPNGDSSLAVGTGNIFTITVTAEDGTVKEYSLDVVRLAKVEGDVTLEAVEVNGKSIGALNGDSFVYVLKGSEDSIAVEVTAALNDSESAKAIVSPASATISDGETKSFTITVTNGGKSATYTLKISYEKQETGNYYWTNKNGCGVNKTISSWSDWTEEMKIAQCAAYDDPRAWRGVQEVNYDVYALYAAYDDENLYVMAELVNPVDRMTAGVGFMWHDYAASDNCQWDNRDIPMGLALNTGKSANPANGPFMADNSVIWGGATGGINFTDSNGIDWLLYHSSKYGQLDGGKFVGVGKPGFFHVTDAGYFSYDSGYCFDVNTGSSKGVSGVDIKYKRNCAVSKSLFFESTPDDNRTTSEQTGETLMASDTYTEIPTSDNDMSYWYTIPLSTLGINKAYLEANGIGIRQLTTNGGSLMDCAPWDPSMVDVASVECEDDASTSAEKRDVDNITTPQARVGHM